MGKEDEEEEGPPRGKCCLLQDGWMAGGAALLLFTQQLRPESRVFLTINQTHAAAAPQTISSWKITVSPRRS